MIKYLFRRFWMLVGIILSVHLLTFILFFKVYSPDQIAQARLGQKSNNSETILAWKKQHHLDKPLFINREKKGIQFFTETMLYDHFFKLISLDFGVALDGQPINQEIKSRILPSILLTAPAFFIGVILSLWLSLKFLMIKSEKLITFFRLMMLVMMSISPIFIMMLFQYIFAINLKLVPLSGFELNYPVKWLILPLMISIIADLAASVRWFSSIIQDKKNERFAVLANIYGARESIILKKEIFPNSLIPISTAMLVQIPLLITGSATLESYFSIAGLGLYSLQGFLLKDFFILRTMILLGTVLYCIGIFLSDIMISFIDPRIRLT